MVWSNVRSTIFIYISVVKSYYWTTTYENSSDVIRAESDSCNSRTLLLILFPVNFECVICYCNNCWPHYVMFCLPSQGAQVENGNLVKPGALHPSTHCPCLNKLRLSALSQSSTVVTGTGGQMNEWRAFVLFYLSSLNIVVNKEQNDFNLKTFKSRNGYISLSIVSFRYFHIPFRGGTGFSICPQCLYWDQTAIDCAQVNITFCFILISLWCKWYQTEQTVCHSIFGSHTYCRLLSKPVHSVVFFSIFSTTVFFWQHMSMWVVVYIGASVYTLTQRKKGKPLNG